MPLAPADRPALIAMILALLAAVPTRAESPATAPTANFTGEWASTFGLLKLTQTGDLVSGTYQTVTLNGQIRGRVAGRKLSFIYEEPRISGEGWFELAADGTSFEGLWREKGTADWAPWRGRRSATKVAEENFSGLWKSDFGSMRLRQSGNRVHGIYSFAGTSHITGEVEGRILKFHYDQPDGEQGTGTFELAADTEKFTGTWTPVKGKGGPWNATRIHAEPGHTWLVILEAPWERTLQENEYSYGLMLKSFLARIPRVDVRHKIIGDEADLRQWCAELPYLPGPIIVYISSHGTKDGMACGGKLLGANVLVDCLRDAGDIRLLHFGTCLIGSGDLPKQLHEQLGSDGNYPISAYVNAADWSGSAIVDFTYFDLIFTRGMLPEDAVRQTRQMLSFARETSGPGDAIAGAGLVIFPAPPVK